MQSISHPFQTRITESTPSDAELLDDAFVRTNGVRDYDSTEADYAALQCDREELIAAFQADPAAMREMAELEAETALLHVAEAYGADAAFAVVLAVSGKMMQDGQPKRMPVLRPITTQVRQINLENWR